MKKSGDFLIFLRVSQGLSQEKICQTLNIDKEKLDLWESGQTLPDSDKLIELANLYHVSINEILTGEQQTIPAHEPKEKNHRTPEKKSGSPQSKFDFSVQAKKIAKLAYDYRQFIVIFLALVTALLLFVPFLKISIIGESVANISGYKLAFGFFHGNEILTYLVGADFASLLSQDLIQQATFASVISFLLFVSLVGTMLLNIIGFTIKKKINLTTLALTTFSFIVALLALIVLHQATVSIGEELSFLGSAQSSNGVVFGFTIASLLFVLFTNVTAQNLEYNFKQSSVSLLSKGFGKLKDFGQQLKERPSAIFATIFFILSLFVLLSPMAFLHEGDSAVTITVFDFLGVFGQFFGGTGTLFTPQLATLSNEIAIYSTAISLFAFLYIVLVILGLLLNMTALIEHKNAKNFNLTLMIILKVIQIVFTVLLAILTYKISNIENYMAITSVSMLQIIINPIIILCIVLYLIFAMKEKERKLEKVHFFKSFYGFLIKHMNATIIVFSLLMFYLIFSPAFFSITDNAGEILIAAPSIFGVANYSYSDIFQSVNAPVTLFMFMVGRYGTMSIIIAASLAIWILLSVIKILFKIKKGDSSFIIFITFMYISYVFSQSALIIMALITFETPKVMLGSYHSNILLLCFFAILFLPVGIISSINFYKNKEKNKTKPTIINQTPLSK